MTLFHVETEDERKQEWSNFLNQPAAVTRDINEYYLSRTPLESYRRMMPVLHPSHRDYSRVETARMALDERDEQARRQKNMRREPQPRTEFNPHLYTGFAVPNIRCFKKVLSLRVPKEYLDAIKRFR